MIESSIVVIEEPGSKKPTHAGNYEIFMRNNEEFWSRLCRQYFP